MQKFEHKIHAIFVKDEIDGRPVLDEIPHALRKQFNFPKNMGENSVNFEEIRKYDVTNKKQRRMWSG